jgi:hypothetical protein
VQRHQAVARHQAHPSHGNKPSRFPLPVTRARLYEPETQESGLESHSHRGFGIRARRGGLGRRESEGRSAGRTCRLRRSENDSRYGQFTLFRGSLSLWVGHDESGENLAILQTIVATCVANDMNPQDYIEDVLLRVQTHPDSEIDDLLPINWEPEV